MNKTIIFLLMMTVIAACNRDPFVEHKLKFEKISEDCANLKPYFRMVSNVGGERFEFEKCLPANFAKEQISAIRQGDTVLVKFEGKGENKILYKITLDIDSYPKYHFITVDNETFAVVTSY